MKRISRSHGSHCLPAVLGAVVCLASMAGCEDTGSPLPADAPIPQPSDRTGFEPETLALFDASIATVRTGPGSESWSRLGRVYHAHDQLEDAISCYRSAVAAGDMTNRTGHLLALALDELGQREEAIDQMRRATSLDQPLPASWWRLAQWELEAGELETAEASMGQAVNLQKNDPAVLQAIGKFLIDTQRPSQALRPLVELVKLNPENAYPHFLLGTALLQSGNEKDGRAHLELGRGSTPSWLDEYQFGLGRLATGPRVEFLRLVNQADRGDAAEFLPRLLQLESRLNADPYYFCSVARLQRKIGQDEEAESSVRKALALNAGHVEANFQLAGVFIDRWRASDLPIDHPLMSEAMMQINATIELNPSSAASRAFRAELLNRMGLVDEASREWQEADRLDLMQRGYGYSAAKVYIDREMWPQAVALLKPYADRFPYDMPVRKQLGLALLEVGEIQEAHVALVLAGSKMPGDLEIKAALERIGNP